MFYGVVLTVGAALPCKWMPALVCGAARGERAVSGSPGYGCLLPSAVELPALNAVSRPDLTDRPCLARLPNQPDNQPPQPSPIPPHSLAAAQLAAFVPCSILEAQGGDSTVTGTAGASAPAPTNGGSNGGSSDAECVMVDAPPAVEALGGGGSSASLEAVPAGDSDALLLLATDHSALRCAAVAYLDGLVAKVGCFGGAAAQRAAVAFGL